MTDTLTDLRWPDWAPRAAAVGIRSMLGAQMCASDEPVGFVSAYSTQPDAFDADDQAVAHLVAVYAAIALGNALQVENLRHAVDARKQIGMAQGILMERFEITADRVFAVLLRYSQDNNIKLRVVADRLVATGRLPGARSKDPTASSDIG